MATRPWVTPQEVQEYTEYTEVKNRSSARLEMDIARAELYVMSYTRNDFSDPEKFPAIPGQIRLAVILIAEMYAFNAATGKGGSYKSETFDDYSYTMRDTDAKLDNLLLGPLLDEFILGGSKAGTDVFMRMRKL
jgi:hypothetical protein